MQRVEAGNKLARTIAQRSRRSWSSFATRSDTESPNMRFSGGVGEENASTTSRKAGKGSPPEPGNTIGFVGGAGVLMGAGAGGGDRRRRRSKAVPSAS